MRFFQSIKRCLCSQCCQTEEITAPIIEQKVHSTDSNRTSTGSASYHTISLGDTLTPRSELASSKEHSSSGSTPREINSPNESSNSNDSYTQEIEELFKRINKK